MHVYMMMLGGSVEIHVNKNLIAMPYKCSSADEFFNLWELCTIPRIYDMLPTEFAAVLIESVSYKYRNVLFPVIARCSR